MAFIYERAVDTRAVEIGDVTPVALLGADVERIIGSLQMFHETWASLIDIGIACWLLQQQLSLAFLAPVVLVLSK